MKIINLKEIEAKLSTSDITFEEFSQGLWFCLCSYKSPQLKALSSQLNIIGKYMRDDNIGNIHSEIMKYLKIDWLLR